MTALDFDPKAIVAACALRGLCTAPEFTPPLTNADFIKRRRKAMGLTARGAIPNACYAETHSRFPKSEVPGVPRQIADLFKDFRRQFTAPFDLLDFQLFLSRENINLKDNTIRLYLNRLGLAGWLVKVHGKFQATQNA